MTSALHLAAAPSYVDTDFRDALGRYASGIVVVTARADSQPVGFTCQSFSSLSLMPPLVLFCASKSSASWQLIRTAGSYTINVLAESQARLADRFASRAGDRFAGVDWEAGESGAPHIDGALLHLDCTLHDVAEGGDHDIAIGRVERARARATGRPLLYFRSSYETLAW